MTICTTNGFNWLEQKLNESSHQKILFFCVCMYKMVVEITKEIWEKCGIKIFIYHNEEERINELWHKMSDIEIQLGHSNIAYVVLKRIRKYCSKKKKKTLQKRKNKNTKRILKVKRVFLLLKNLHVI